MLALTTPPTPNAGCDKRLLAMFPKREKESRVKTAGISTQGTYDYSANSGKRTNTPVAQYTSCSFIKSQTPLSVVQVQTVKMDWSRDELHGRRGDELCSIGPPGFGGEKFGEIALQRGWEVCELWCDYGREVEGCKDGERVAEGEESV